MKLVITMSRRFGTGASIIADELSKRLDIPVYDRAYIEQQVNDRMYDSEAEAIRNLAEKPCIILGRCASDILKDRLYTENADSVLRRSAQTAMYEILFFEIQRTWKQMCGMLFTTKRPTALQPGRW